MKPHWPRVWPPLWFTATCLLAHALLVGFTYWAYQSGLERPPGGLSGAYQQQSPLFLIGLAVVYGAYRVLGFHPVVSPPYRDWLVRTPWTSRQPLPLGPVHLIAADAAALGLASVASWPLYGIGESLAIIKAFLLAYLLTLAVVLMDCKRLYPGCAVWFGVGGMALVCTTDWPFAAAAALTYAAGQWGLRQSLDAIPTATPLAPNVVPPRQAFPSPAARWRALGWPFGYLAPVVDQPALSRRHRVVVSLVWGWTGYVLVSLPGAAPIEPGVWSILGLIAVGLLLWYPSEYHLLQYASPLSVAGRIATGRWFIPSNDRVLAPPLLMLVVLLIYPAVGGTTGNGASAAGVTLGLLFLTAFVTGPERSHWHLCGNVRIAPVPPPPQGKVPAWVRVSL